MIESTTRARGKEIGIIVISRVLIVDAFLACRRNRRWHHSSAREVVCVAHGVVRFVWLRDTSNCKKKCQRVTNTLQNCTIPYSDPVEVSIPTAKEKVHRARILPDITLCQPIVD